MSRMEKLGYRIAKRNGEPEAPAPQIAFTPCDCSLLVAVLGLGPPLVIVAQGVVAAVVVLRLSLAAAILVGWCGEAWRGCNDER